MQLSHHPQTAELPFEPRPPRFTVLQSRSATIRPSVPVRPAEGSPLHSVQAFAGAMFVATAAAGWIAVAATASAPLIVAGELLSRAGRGFEKH